MNNKVADYAKDGDAIRADTAKDVADKLHQLYFRIAEQKLALPKFSEINKMPLGFSDEELITDVATKAKMWAEYKDK